MWDVSFEIINSKKRKAKPCAWLNFCSDTGWSIDISPEAGAEEVPAFFVPFIEQGKRTIGNEQALKWVQERIVPPGRQNLNEILDKHGLLEYEEVSLLVSSEGISSLDDFVIRETSSKQSMQQASERKAETQKAIGKSIKKAREELGLTQSELARRLGIHQPALSKIEQGKTNPTIDLLSDISNALEVKICDLLKTPERFLWNKQRKDLFELLKQRSSELAYTYKRLVDELEMYSEKNDSAVNDSAVIAHCLRELMNAFPAFNFADETLPNGVQNREDEARKQLAAELENANEIALVEGLEYALIPKKLAENLSAYRLARIEGADSRKAREAVAVYGSSNGSGGALLPWRQAKKLAESRAHLQRKANPLIEKSCNYLKALDRFEAIARTNLDNITDVKTDLERLVRRANSINAQGEYEKPLYDDVMKALSYTGERHLEYWFYSELKNPLWLDVLDRAGAFSVCLDQTSLDDRGDDFAPFPYLLLCTSQCPSKVVKFIIKNKNSSNHLFRIFVLDAINLLPGDDAESIVEVLVEWAKEHYMADGYFWDPSDLKPFIEKLLDSNEPSKQKKGAKLFFELVKLFRVEGRSFPEINACIKRFAYPDFVSTGLKKMNLKKRFHESRHHIQAWIDLNWGEKAKTISSRGIALELRPDKDDTTYRTAVYFYVWIEELIEAIKGQLKENPLEVSKWINNADGLVIRAVMLAYADYLKDKADFKEIDDEPLRLIEKVLDAGYVYDVEYSYEAIQLLSEYCQICEQSFIDAFLAHHCERLSKAKQEREEREVASGEELEVAKELSTRYASYSSWEILSQFDEKSLSPSWLQEKRRLEEELGKYERIEHPFEVQTAWGPNSPISAGKIKNKGPEAIIQFLLEWEPNEQDRFNLVEPEGLARELKEALKECPDFFAGQTSRLKRLRLSYIEEILNGWSDAIESGKSIPIDQAIDICKWAAFVDEASLQRIQIEPSVYSDGLHGLKRAAARLLKEILGKEKSLSSVRMQAILGTIECLAIPNKEDIEWEKNYENGDLLTPALNLLRSIAIQAAGKWISHPSSLSVELRGRATKVLDSALPQQATSSSDVVALALVMGPLIDAGFDWPVQKYEELFGAQQPVEMQKQLLSAILGLYQPNGRLMEYLKPALTYALKTNPEEYPDFSIGFGSKGFLQRSGEWIYTLGATSPRMQESALFQQWFKISDSKTKGRVLNSICSLLERQPNVEAQIVENVRQLWEKHKSIVAQQPTALKGARHLVALHRFDDDWLCCALMEEAKLGNLPESAILFSDDVIQLMMRNAAWGIEFLAVYLASNKGEIYPFVYQNFASDLCSKYLEEGGSSDSLYLRACKDSLGRMGYWV